MSVEDSKIEAEAGHIRINRLEAIYPVFDRYWILMSSEHGSVTATFLHMYVLCPHGSKLWHRYEPNLKIESIPTKGMCNPSGYHWRWIYQSEDEQDKIVTMTPQYIPETRIIPELDLRFRNGRLIGSDEDKIIAITDWNVPAGFFNLDWVAFMNDFAQLNATPHHELIQKYGDPG